MDAHLEDRTMTERMKIQAIVEVLHQMLEVELDYRGEHTSSKANVIFGRDYDLQESLKIWMRLEK